MFRYIRLLWSVGMVLTFSIFLAIFDPDFEPEDNNPKSMCDFAREAFRLRDIKEEERLWGAFWIAFVVFGVLIMRSISRVLWGLNDDE